MAIMKQGLFCPLVSAFIAHEVVEVDDEFTNG
jgi:predicted metal-dependent hydrolase